MSIRRESTVVRPDARVLVSGLLTVLTLVVLLCGGVAFAQSTDGTAAPASVTSSDIECPQPDATDAYLGSDAPKVVTESVTSGTTQTTVRINNLSRKICNQTTNGFNVTGTCDAPDKCDARFCTDLSGNKVLCPTQYLDTASLTAEGATAQDISSLSANAGYRYAEHIPRSPAGK